MWARLCLVVTNKWIRTSSSFDRPNSKFARNVLKIGFISNFLVVAIAVFDERWSDIAATSGVVCVDCNKLCHFTFCFQFSFPLCWEMQCLTCWNDRVRRTTTKEKIKEKKIKNELCDGRRCHCLLHRRLDRGSSAAKHAQWYCSHFAHNLANPLWPLCMTPRSKCEVNRARTSTSRTYQMWKWINKREREKKNIKSDAFSCITLHVAKNGQ